MKTKFAVEHRLDAPADTIYHLLADYREHHRPGGFLPPAFSDQEVIQGGVGAGTELQYVITVGGRPRTIRATVSEPIAGRKLVEQAPGVETTVTIEPLDTGTTRVRFDTELDEPGVAGVMSRLFGARLLAPVYRDELARLAAYATAHPDASNSGHARLGARGRGGRQKRVLAVVADVEAVVEQVEHVDEADQERSARPAPDR